MKVIIDSTDLHSIFLIKDTLCKNISPALVQGRSIVFLCIGSDRSTGDSLGPLIGHKLKFLSNNNIFIYGNLENPVHAKNLISTLKKINTIYNNPYIIAIDACLGRLQNVGKIIIENKPIFPGSAVKKSLPPIGNMSITGVVNISGNLEFMVLQNTRLFTVMHLAEIISSGIYYSIENLPSLRKA